MLPTNLAEILPYEALSSFVNTIAHTTTDMCKHSGLSLIEGLHISDIVTEGATCKDLPAITSQSQKLECTIKAKNWNVLPSSVDRIKSTDDNATSRANVYLSNIASCCA